MSHLKHIRPADSDLFPAHHAAPIPARPAQPVSGWPHRVPNGQWRLRWTAHARGKAGRVRLPITARLDTTGVPSDLNAASQYRVYAWANREPVLYVVQPETDKTGTWTRLIAITVERDKYRYAN